MDSYLQYPLQNGFIHNWLSAGPHAQPVAELERFTQGGSPLKMQIAQYFYATDSGLSAPPRELDKFTLNSADGSTTELTWRAIACDDDHFVYASGFYHTCHYLRTWAFACIDSPVAQGVTFTLTTNGPADLWLNDQHVHRQEHFSHQIPHRVAFAGHLQAGRNMLLVRFEGVAIRECPNVMALHLAQTTADAPLQVVLPTAMPALARRNALAELFATAWLDRDVFARDEVLEVHWPQPLKDNIALRLQSHAGRIYSEQHTQGRVLEHTRLGRGYQFPEGPYRIVLMPHPDDYYIRNLRVERTFDMYIVGNRTYATEPYGTYMERRIEALNDAAQRNSGLFSEIAKMALGRWDMVKTEAIQATLDKINSRADCSDFDMVGLLGMVYRYWEDPAFPDEVRDVIQACVLDFKYWMDEPGDDAMCYWSENHQILFHTCQILAGQLFPDEIFSNNSQTGTWHQAQGEGRALSWLAKRAAGGLREWDSNTYLEEDVLALTHLAELAESDEVAEMAAVVLDKLFFGLALNSYKGVFGSTHGRAYSSGIKGAYREPTSGIARIAWGLGIFNSSLRGTVSLACADAYQVPAMIALLATGQIEELWNRERHAGELEEWCDRATGAWEVNKVTYRTPDYMLSSAQDYQPGQAGYQQHIWQATFSPDAVVFVTHPSCVSEDGAHRPNFWHGNVVLPRVAQWKDVLVAVHNFPADDWMGFTHAYFPAYAFDESVIRDSWAFARVGDGYLALTASCGLEQVTYGKNAYRELRSCGTKNVWFCQMGRAALDGTFAEFQAKVLALGVSFTELSAHAETLRGDSIDFGWEGPLLVNERVEAITGFKHFDNPFCQVEIGAEQMEILVNNQLMRLNFSLQENQANL